MDKKRRDKIRIFHAMKITEKLNKYRTAVETLLGYKEAPMPKEIERQLNKELKNFANYLEIQKQYIQVRYQGANYAYGIYTLGSKIQEEIEKEENPIRKEILHKLAIVAQGIQGEEFIEEVRSKTGKYITDVENPSKGDTGLPLEYNKRILEHMYDIEGIRVNKNQEFNLKYTVATRLRLSSKPGKYYETIPLLEGEEIWTTYKYLYNTNREEFYRKVVEDYGSLKPKITEILKQLALETLKRYRTLGISEQIFMDTFTKLENVKDVERAIDMKCFKIGRLSYQILNIEEIKDLKDKLIAMDSEMSKSALKKLSENKLALLNVYVDDIGPLDYYQCQKSYKEAAEFFIRYFIEIGEYEPRFAFIFNGWLLNKELSNYLPEQSNILKFQSDYEIIAKNADNTLMLKHIFGDAKIPTNDLPETTTLQKNVKKALLEGEKFGSYRGIYYDSNNELEINYPEGLLSYKTN